MPLNLINTGGLTSSDRLVALFGATFICVFILTPRVGLSSDPNSQISSSESLADGNDAAKDSNGPTIIMSYSKKQFVKNPIESFMYFVPLIAPTLVDNISSANNEQQAAIISYEKTVTSNSFYLACDFEILGSGFHMNTFDFAGMIAAHTDELKKGGSLTDMLDYIKFDGEGFGRLEIKGTMASSTPTVTEVAMQFNARGHKSPVTIGLYDIKPKDGQYRYEDRSNRIVARVNSLVFKKTEKTPRMGILVASISDAEESEGLISGIKGCIANLFITPPEVTKLGNTTMLEFGEALLQKNTTFTFPKAKNIKESRIASIDHIQK